MSRRTFAAREVWHWASFALLVVLGLCLRLYGLEARSLWHDESHSIAFVRAPASMMNAYLRLDDHPPVYYWLLRGWMALPGSADGLERAAWGRLLSALCSAAALPFAYWLARQLAGRAAALAALALMAVSPFAIYYGQELRMYALESLWVAIMMALAPGALKRPTPARIAGVLACGTLAAYTHYFGALFVIGFLAVLAATKREGETGRGRAAIRAAAGALFCVVLYIPWLVPGLEHVLVNSLGGMKSAGQFGERDAWLAFQQKGVQATLGLRPDFPLSGQWFPDIGMRIAAIDSVAIALAAALLFALLGGIIALRRDAVARRFAIAFVGIPWAIAIVYEWLGGRFYERFLTPVLPAGFALAAAGMWAIPGRLGKWVLLGAILPVMAASSASYLSVDLRDVACEAFEAFSKAEMELEIKNPEARDAPILHAQSHSFWNLRAYDAHPERHRFLPGPDEPALARLMYGRPASITNEELQRLDVVWVAYSSWGAPPNALRARTEARYFKNSWMAVSAQTWSRFGKSVQIVLYRRNSAAR